MWCLVWHFFYEFPRDDDVIYISFYPCVRLECPSVNLFRPGHLKVDAFDNRHYWKRYIVTITES